MRKKLLQHKFFLTGAFVCLLFVMLSFLGYGITLDASPNANNLMPEWSQLKPGTQKLALELKRKQVRDWYFWLVGDEGFGGYLSVKGPVRIFQDTIHFVSEKTNEKLQIPLEDLQNSQVKQLRFVLGTDGFGRDILSRLIIGGRISLSIGFLSMLLSLVIGITIGLLSGYFGGWVDRFWSYIITVFWSLPTLLLALGLSVFLGKGYIQVLIATGLSTWVEVARVVRGQTMQLKNQEFVSFARITGFSNFRIVTKHILPNLTGTLSVLATTNFASAILLEAGLGFLGLGVAPPIPSWGIMVKENLGFLVLDQAYLAIIPGIAIMLLVMAFNLISMGVRDHIEN